MNDRDEKKFSEWLKNSWANIDSRDYPNLLSREAWHAACEYKEIENKKLREALEFYVDRSNWIGNHYYFAGILCDHEPLIREDGSPILLGGKRAREALKEVGENETKK